MPTHRGAARHPARLQSSTIKRLFMYRGTKQSFAMASCANGHLSAKISAVFTNGRDELPAP